jgi:hypothetical protein
MDPHLFEEEISSICCCDALLVGCENGHIQKPIKYHKYTIISLLGGLIQVDIGGHPPFPNGSKQFSGHFGNLLFLAGFHFRGHFEGLNEFFSR